MLMKYDMQEYLNKNRVAVYVTMDIKNLPETRIKFIPEIDFEKSVPSLLECKDPTDAAQIISEKIVPSIFEGFFLTYNRKKKTVESVIVSNTMFSKVFYFNDLDAEFLNAVTEAVEKNEDLFDDEENIDFTIRFVGMMSNESKK